MRSSCSRATARIDAMRDWYAEGKPLGNWTIPYLLRHTAYHVLDHTWEMEEPRPQR